MGSAERTGGLDVEGERDDDTDMEVVGMQVPA